MGKFYSIKNHLIQFQQKNGIKIDLISFKRSFYDKLLNYFIHEKHLNSSIKEAHLPALNGFLNWAVNNEYIEENKFKGIRFPFVVTERYKLALNESEVKTLHDLDLSNNKRLRDVRDVFLIECYTGVRYSDVNKITSDNIKGNELHIYTQKSAKNNVIIPLRKEAIEIINRYRFNNKELPLKSNQKMNDYLKELGELAGFIDSIIWVEASGRNMVEKKAKKYEKLSTHVGRRTFITTNINRGMTPHQIMPLTTHSTFKEFNKYYQANTKDLKKAYLEAWSKLKTPFSTEEIILRLVKSAVSISKIAEAYKFKVSDIKEIL